MHQKQPPAKMAVSIDASGLVLIADAPDRPADCASGAGSVVVVDVVTLADALAGSAADDVWLVRASASLGPQLTSASDRTNGTRRSRIRQPLNAGSFSPASTKISATPLLQYRLPVGCGPSSKMCP